MAKSLSLSELFEDGKYPKLILAVGAILLLLLQLGIFLAVYNQSGLKSRVSILDSSGAKIYESPGPALSSYEKMVFENNFGSLRDYTTRLESDVAPFNYRAWILLAVGMPLGLILMLFFMAQVWLILLNGSPKEEIPEETQLNKTRFSTFMSVSKNFSILGVGFTIVVTMLILWLIPSIMSDMAKSLFNAVKDYPWFFTGVCAFIGGLLVWVIYLRYRLSKQMLENQVEIEKYRIQQQLLEQNPVPHLLTGRSEPEETREQFMQGEH
ncbi:MAG: hypothetical protein ABSF90_04420 [Syntrophobacteraceae bacterium]|jgi:hypothetical protein